MRTYGVRLSLCLLLAVFVLSLLITATPAQASKLSTWILGGASAYEFSRGNEWAGLALGAGAYYTWQRQRAASRVGQVYSYPRPQTYGYAQPQQYVYVYPAAPVSAFPSPPRCDHFTRYCR